MTTRWIAVAGAAALREAARGRIVSAASRAIEARGRFLVCLSGGNTPRDVYRLLRGAPCDWARWHVYFGDERCAPPGDPARNSRMAGDAWLDHAAIPRTHVHEVPAELGPAAGAEAYAGMIAHIGDFDLVLLGLGEDGHTASLFPGHDWGTAADSPDALAVTDAPKPPPERVSLSAARLSRARDMLFIVDGEAKREAVARWQRGENIPARAVRADSGVDVLVEASLLAER